MVGSSARSYGVDRFYNPPAVRRQLEQQRKQRELLKHPSSAPPTKPAPAQKSRPSSQPLPEDRRIELEASSFKASASCSSAAASVAEVPAGNLDRFLESITPIVPALYFPKMSVRGWRSDSMEPQKPYFSLGDLWESFKEWSAYGAGVPLVLNESDWVLQYYVPYLSAIQLFVDPNMSSLRLRRPGDESDGDPYLDTSSEGTSESGEADMLTRDRPFMGSTSCVRQKASVSEYGEFLSSSILPEFEYLESDLPHFREPLANKISTLASKFHDLKSYKSCDLLPSSWMSVAWYPIYRIPIGSTLQDLDACFLTFHFLSAPSKGMSSGYPEVMGPRITSSNYNLNIAGTLRVPVFGLASYKFKSFIWTSNSLHEQQLASSLLQAADNWLHLRRVEHPDFKFFKKHFNM